MKKSKLYIWVKSVVAKFRSPMSNLTPFQKLREIRKQIFESIRKALSELSDCETFIADAGMALYICIRERDFRIVSHMKDGYSKLLLTVMEGKVKDVNPEALYLVEAEELQMVNEITLSENYDRPMRGNFIGDSPYHISNEDIGKEFADKLREFLNV